MAEEPSDLLEEHVRDVIAAMRGEHRRHFREPLVGAEEVENAQVAACDAAQHCPVVVRVFQIAGLLNLFWY